jgi:hypothetical protein
VRAQRSFAAGERVGRLPINSIKECAMVKKLAILGCSLFVLAVPTAVQGQVAFGPQISWGDDADLGVGARVVFGLPQLYAGLEGIISADYFFPDCGGGFGGDDFDCTWIEINANGVIPVPLGEGSFNPYVGGGLNIARVSVSFMGQSDSNTELGLNVLGGLKFPMGSFTPFVEAKFTLSGGEQFVLSGGLLFGGGR